MSRWKTGAKWLDRRLRQPRSVRKAKQHFEASVRRVGRSKNVWPRARRSGTACHGHLMPDTVHQPAAVTDRYPSRQAKNSSQAVPIRHAAARLSLRILPRRCSIWRGSAQPDGGIRAGVRLRPSSISAPRFGRTQPGIGITISMRPFRPWEWAQKMVSIIVFAPISRRGRTSRKRYRSAVDPTRAYAYYAHNGAYYIVVHTTTRASLRPFRRRAESAIRTSGQGETPHSSPVSKLPALSTIPPHYEDRPLVCVRPARHGFPQRSARRFLRPTFIRCRGSLELISATGRRCRPQGCRRGIVGPLLCGVMEGPAARPTRSSRSPAPLSPLVGSPSRDEAWVSREGLIQGAPTFSCWGQIETSFHLQLRDMKGSVPLIR